MKNLMYVGGDDIRELSPSDLEQLGVEDAEATLSFKKGRSLTVDDKVADALLGKIQNLREATKEEMEAEIRNIEAELGFAPYDPTKHTVEQVANTLANSSDERRKYILEQEAANQNRKGVFQAVGAKWSPKEEAAEPPEMTEEEMAAQKEAVDAEVVDLAEQAADTAEAGGTTQTTTGTTSGTRATGGTAGPANTSPSA